VVAGGHHLLVLPTVATLLAIAVLHKEEIAAPFLLCISEMELGALKQKLAVTDGTKLGFTTKTFRIARAKSHGFKD